MTINNKETSPIVYFGERQSDWSNQTTRTEHIAKSHSTTPARIREQQRTRDYWAKAYGSDAEIRSRGGVTWMM